MIKQDFLKDINEEVIGIDEVGRGALCGPVVACSILLNKSILNENLVIEINDSKKLTEEKREELSEFIKKFSLYSFGMASNNEIDDLNILQATILSMKRSFERFLQFPNKVRIDGTESFHLNKRSSFLKKGDQKSASIAAASILAKTYRDSIMKKISIEFPEYDWSKNKGYGTKKHIIAIRKFGLTFLHRKSFISQKILNS
jgi:ribonuclease HII